MSRLEDLIRQKKEIEVEIKKLKEYAVTTNRTRVSITHIDKKDCDIYRLDIKGDKTWKTGIIYTDYSKDQFILSLDYLIKDLQETKRRLEDEQKTDG